jgi:hypothetical protein
MGQYLVMEQVVEDINGADEGVIYQTKLVVNRLQERTWCIHMDDFRL